MKGRILIAAMLLVPSFQGVCAEPRNDSQMVEKRRFRQGVKSVAEEETPSERKAAKHKAARQEKSVKNDGAVLSTGGRTLRTAEVNSDPEAGLAQAREVLELIRMQAPFSQQSLDDFEAVSTKSIYTPETDFYAGLNLFDEGEYAKARERLAKSRKHLLSKSQIAQSDFCVAYCDFALEDFDAAEEEFRAIEQKEFSDYTTPSRYALGYINYDRGAFLQAFKYFEKASVDPRFKQPSEYYMLECRFMEKDYAYVMEHGEKLYNELEGIRRDRLGRILSETYLVNGDNRKAGEFFKMDSTDADELSFYDLFYAGSLQYSFQNWSEASAFFSAMEPGSKPESGAEAVKSLSVQQDSLLQIARYQLGNCQLQLKNKVAAMEAWKEAAACNLDPVIQEDAWFNWAKLSFDLNHDPAPFKSYVGKYSDSKRGDTVYAYMALAALYSHDYAGAIEAYDNVDDLTPEMRSNYMKANYLRSRQLIGLGAWSQAAPGLRTVAYYAGRTDNLGQLSRYWLAECLYRTGNYDQAQTILTDLYNTSALERQPEGRLIPYNIAYCCFNQGDYGSASRWFSMTDSAEDSVLRDAAVRRADCDFLRKDYKSAISSYSAVIGRWNDLSDIYPIYRLGLAYGLSGRNADKAQALQGAVNASPEAPFYSDALYELGRTYVVLKKPAQARETFERLVDTSRDTTFAARSLIELGMLSRNSSDHAAALDYYKQVVRDYPRSGFKDDALLAIESIYQSDGRPGEYLKYLEELETPVVKTAVQKEDIFFGSAEQVFFSGNYARALVSLDEYLNEFPQGANRAKALYYKAESYKALGDKENACKFYAACGAETEGNSFREASTLSLANILLSLQRYSEAYSAYRTLGAIAAIDENRLAAQAGMMQSAYLGGDYANAIEAARLREKDQRCSDAQQREARYIRAQSLLKSSHRDEAYGLFAVLAAEPATDEGAEATYLVIQDTYDRGDFDKIEDMVYKFADKAPDQSHWLAKAFIVLADSFVENDNPRQAKATFESILSGYEPESDTDDVISTVKMRLSKLNELL